MDTGGLRGLIDGNRAGMDDIRINMEDVDVSGDIVTVIGRLRGTHTGEFLGIAPTGRSVDVKTIAVHRVADGRIVESWGSRDRLDLLKQIKG